MLSVLFLLAGLLCFIFRAFGFAPFHSVDLGWLGLAFWIFVALYGAATPLVVNRNNQNNNPNP